MRRLGFSLLILISLFMAAKPAEEPRILDGYSAASSQTERSWEEKFRAIPNPANLRDYMQHLSARPHHVGSPYDKQNAEWIRAKFQEFGFDAKIETFYVLFPTPKERAVELVAPTRFVAKLQEPPVPADPPVPAAPSVVPPDDLPAVPPESQAQKNKAIATTKNRLDEDAPPMS